MYCPRCSQEQASEDLRFCSRCGFPLAAVSQILARGGTLPPIAAPAKSKIRLTRRSGKIISLFWAMFFLLLLAPIFDIIKIPELASMAAVIGVFGGLLIFLASIFFLPKPPEEAESPQLGGAFGDDASLAGARAKSALPPMRSTPAAAHFRPTAQSGWRETNDLVQPNSVVEGTTKLLEKEEG